MSEISDVSLLFKRYAFVDHVHRFSDSDPAVFRVPNVNVSPDVQVRNHSLRLQIEGFAVLSRFFVVSNWLGAFPHLNEESVAAESSDPSAPSGVPKLVIRPLAAEEGRLQA